MFKNLFIAAVLVLGFSSLASAQATAGSKLAWDQPAANLAEANSFSYKHYDDASTTGVVLSSVTCTGSATPFLCQTLFPAFNPGATHTIAVTATNPAGESLKSTPLSFTFIVIPNPPQNLRIIP